MSEPYYLLTINIAEKGTPLLDPDRPYPTSTGENSQAGHMWYSIKKVDGEKTEEYSFGFGREEGDKTGEATDKDNRTYYNPRYKRTIEIPKEKYDALKEFGEKALKREVEDFEKYNVVNNSCVDFTWAALKSAGLERRQTIMTKTGIEIALPGKEAIPARYDGQLWPINNVKKVDQIAAPIPDSPHNSVHHGPSAKEAQAELRRKEQAAIFKEDPKKALALYPDDARLNTADKTLAAVSDRFSGSKRGNAIVLKMQRNLAHRLEHDSPLPNPRQAFGMIANALERGGRGD